MDRKSLIGLLLIGAVLIGYSILTRPSKEEMEETRRIRDSIEQAEIRKQLEAERILREQDSLRNLSAAPVDTVDQQMRQRNELGVFADTGEGTPQQIVMENQRVRLTFTTLGGRLYSAELKEYKTHDGQPLLLFDGDSTQFNMQFYTQDRKVISTQNLHFTPQTDDDFMLVEDEPRTLVMRLEADPYRYIDFVYTLLPDSYQVDLTMRFQGMEGIISQNTTYLDLIWAFPMRQQEKGYRWESQYSNIYYKFYQDEVEHLPRNKPGSDDLSTKVEWIGFKQQFFSSVLRSRDYFSSAQIMTQNREEESGYLKNCEADISLPFNSQSTREIPLSFYFVPNHFKTLKKIGFEFSELVDLGWPFISWINKWFVVNIFHYLESIIGNYGIIIIILTIFFKLLVFPLSYRSTISGVKMRVLKPQIDELSKKFSKDKQMEKQQATMALYRKAGVNPMGGCLPALLQMPIWLALFRFFPASIELRQQSFLWAKDLSTYDSILDLPFTIPAYGDHISLFTLLMAISMLVTTRINMEQTATTQPMPGMKLMMYIMPVMMLVWFNSYASGLSFYYFVSNFISYIQQLVIKRSINEEKVLAKLNQNQKKPPKKSKFQARLEEMSKQRGNYPPPKKRR